MATVKCKSCGTVMNLEDMVLNHSVPDTEYNDLLAECLFGSLESDLAYDCDCLNPDCQAPMRIYLNLKFEGFSVNDLAGDELEVDTTPTAPEA